MPIAEALPGRRHGWSRAGRRDEGVALVLVLLATALLLALGLGLLIVTDIEVASATNARTGRSTFYAADAALNLAISEAAAVGDWSPLVGGSRTSGFVDAASTPGTAWGTTIDVPAMTAALQAESDGALGSSLNGPQWRLYVSAPLAAILPAGALTSAAYLLVWVGDDPAETDGDPAVDTNRSILLHACALEPRGARREVEAWLARPVPGGVVQLVSWREVQ